MPIRNGRIHIGDLNTAEPDKMSALRVIEEDVTRAMVGVPSTRPDPNLRYATVSCSHFFSFTLVLVPHSLAALRYLKNRSLVPCFLLGQQGGRPCGGEVRLGGGGYSHFRCRPKAGIWENRVAPSRHGICGGSPRSNSSPAAAEGTTVVVFDDSSISYR